MISDFSESSEGWISIKVGFEFEREIGMAALPGFKFEILFSDSENT